ncbi:hypothetical protein SteCoe_6938 [Stentor coeruleus]|uniref:Uncharacterized protein n=1 Tax=Stentor coeruleus TaxID=5963 RepID=A0A1R2CNR7_9CILI|nr:hypothetical protein SteCoe_6938 [Stentor coeruleus]
MELMINPSLRTYSLKRVNKERFHSRTSKSLLIYSQSCIKTSLAKKKIYFPSQDTSKEPETENFGKSSLGFKSRAFMQCPTQLNANSSTYLKANLLLNKLKTALSSMDDESFSPEKELEIYNLFFYETLKYLKPFEEIFKLIFDGIKKYCKNETHIAFMENEKKLLEETNQNLIGENRRLCKEKILLVKKLEKCTDDLEIFSTKNLVLISRIKELEIKLNSVKDFDKKTEGILSKFMKQSEKMQKQKSELQFFMLQDQKNRRVLELIKTRFDKQELDEVISRVSKEYTLS